MFFNETGIHNRDLADSLPVFSIWCSSFDLVDNTLVSGAVNKELYHPLHMRKNEALNLGRKDGLAE